jgi:hypothetical protein
MTTRTAETSPLVYARLTGLLLLLLVVVGPFSQLYVPSTLIVPGDATATADNIRASESLFLSGIVGQSIVFLTEIVLTVLLYVLFRPVSRTLSLVAAFARLALAIIQGINLLPFFIALLLLSGAGYLTVFEPDQLDAVGCARVGISQCAWIWGFYLATIFWLSFVCAWLFDLQVGLLSQNSGHLDGTWIFRLSVR